MELLKGKPVADLICQKVQAEAEELLEKYNDKISNNVVISDILVNSKKIAKEIKAQKGGIKLVPLAAAACFFSIVVIFFCFFKSTACTTNLYRHSFRRIAGCLYFSCFAFLQALSLAQAKPTSASSITPPMIT